MSMTWGATDGLRYTTKQRDVKISKAKGKLLALQLDEHGYNFCLECKRKRDEKESDPFEYEFPSDEIINPFKSQFKPMERQIIDCSHHIESVKILSESGKVDLCWNIDYMEPTCRKCHQERDKSGLMNSKK